MFIPKLRILVIAISSLFFFTGLTLAQESQTALNPVTGKTYNLYPYTYETPPNLPSPFTSENGTEIIVGFLKNEQYALIPVTVENGEPYSRKYRLYGKGNQLGIDGGDFPTLGKTGLHSEQELDAKEMITGRLISVINYIGRPGRFSYEGFMSHDEDIISILKGDNRIVEGLGLTHPQMAIPIFHVWNLILDGFWDKIVYVLYNGKKVYISAQGGKGYQESIFHDEIHGGWNIHIWRVMDQEEKDFINKKYSQLNEEQKSELLNKLSHIHTGEMEPFYIMRYGFYEGHTNYRVDPLAVSFIFGLKSLKEIEASFNEEIHKTLTEHFTAE